MNTEIFLEKLAKYILKTAESDMQNTLVVFPNKRPAIFLKKYLTQLAGKTLWLPEILSIDDFMSKVSKLEYEDPLKIYFQFYSPFLFL